MRWEELTSDQFPQVVHDVQGVCLLPFACLERHAHHLPVGTDVFIAREVCRRAAAVEPAVIFPDFFYTQILEARHYPGAVGLEPELFMRLIDGVCREIARNGFKKIVIVNAHGGNGALIQFLAQIQLASPRDYVLYIAQPPLAPEEEAALKAQWATTVDGHAGESETSEILAIAPQLVHLEQAPADGEGLPQERLQALHDAGVATGIWWYADHPSHYRGDARPATAEKGHRELEAHAQALVRALRAIKADTEAPRLQAEFYASLAQPLARVK